MFNTPNYNYNNNYPWNNYINQPITQPQVQVQSNGINWVQGEAGAKSYAIAPGQSALLVDSEKDVFYIKTSDASGMPMPLRIFDFKERVATPPKQETTQQQQPPVEYITRKEFEKRIAEIQNGKQHIQSTKQQ